MNLPPTFPLSMAAEHTPVRVVSIKGTPDFAKRIAEMGLNPGAEISVCQRSGSGLLVSRSGTRLALGGGMAALDRRYRKKRTASAAASASVNAPPAPLAEGVTA